MLKGLGRSPFSPRTPQPLTPGPGGIRRRPPRSGTDDEPRPKPRLTPAASSRAVATKRGRTRRSTRPRSSTNRSNAISTCDWSTGST